MLATTINVGPVDPVVVYAFGWMCLGGGWGLARGFAELAKKRHEQERRFEALGMNRPKLELEVVFGAVVGRTASGVAAGFLVGALIGLLLGLLGLIFGVAVHNESTTPGL